MNAVMPHRILGLHHVTATVDEAQADLDFCVGTLGLRLVKKTVNFDNRHVFHFYYGDERGTPGTIWTTFPYHGRNVRVGTKGAGQITATSFSVLEASLGFWQARLRDAGLEVRERRSRFGEDTLAVVDPSGLTIELVGAISDSREPWNSGDIAADAGVRGLHSVTLTVHAFAPTVEFLTETFGFDVADGADGRTRLAIGDGTPGRTLDVLEDPAAPRAINGLGTVHHVALAIASPEEQLALREDLVDRGISVTDVMDRQYFKSIYFREPGGVLLEVATVEPGFTLDETVEGLGRELKLPPWEEPNRNAIEAGLPAIHVRT